MKINCTEKTIWKSDTFCNVCRAAIEAGEEFMRDPETNYRKCMSCYTGAGKEALQYHIDLLDGKDGETKATINKTKEVVNVELFEGYSDSPNAKNHHCYESDAIDGTLADGTSVKLHTIQDPVEDDQWIAVLTN